MAAVLKLAASSCWWCAKVRSAGQRHFADLAGNRMGVERRSRCQSAARLRRIRKTLAVTPWTSAALRPQTVANLRAVLG